MKTWRQRADNKTGSVLADRVAVCVLVLVLVGSVFTVLALSMTARAADTSPASPQAAPSRSLRIGVAGQKAVTVNPNGITLLLEFVVVYNVYSTLVTRDGQYRITGDLAQRWEVAPDNVTWTFHLVRNAFFTDPKAPSDRSHPVTAADVVFSYNMEINHNGSILYAYTSEIATVTALDAYTVQIVTLGPYAAMYSTLASIPIFPEYLWSSVTDPVSQEPTGYAGVPVGSGATYYDTNSALSSGPIILKRNPNYFGDAVYCQASRPSEVRFLLYTSSGTLVDDFGSGASKLDAIFNIPSSSYLNAAVLSQAGVTRQSVSGGFVGEFSANAMTDSGRATLVASGLSQFQTGHNNQILATSQTVRKAIAMSVDRAAIVKYAYLGLATVGDTLVPKSNPWHLNVPAAQQFKFDTAAARKLLNDAGWKYDSGGTLNPGATPLYQAAGQNPLIFRFYTPNSHSEFEPAVANITVWLKQSGIQTTDEGGRTTPGYEVKDENQMGSIWLAGDYDLWLWDWIFSAVSDPSVDILQVETTGAIGPTSDNFYSDATYDSLYNQSLVTTDLYTRRQLTDRMQKMLYDYASYNILYYANDLYAFTNRSSLGYGWENWGDWTQSPGLVPDSDLPNLWFNVYPHDNPPPVILAFPSLTHEVGYPLTISVVAADPNDAQLTYTWDFGDGSPTVITSTSSVSHTYNQQGSFLVSVRAQDAEFPACGTMTATIGAAGSNAPPNGVLSYQFVNRTSHGLMGKSIAFNLNASDADDDPVFVNWDFGDGTTVTNFVSGTLSGAVVSQAHSYSVGGNYTLVVTLSDNQTGFGHRKVLTVTLPIWSIAVAGGGGEQPNPANLWISYGVPIAIVLVVAGAIVGVILRRRKTAKEDERPQDDTEQPKPPPPP